MSFVPETPRKQTASGSTPAATPTTSRVSTSHILQSSPHYATTRRHSLYGTEDRVVIDTGSRIWKIGFSGEGKPRDVCYADRLDPGCSLWNLNRATDSQERAEQDRLLEIKLEKALRYVFHEALLTDPKSRKIILVEHPLLPIYIKDMIARILFDNLHVPSISFASSHLLSLLSIGRITGLVIDCGHLESIVLPIFASRPLYPYLRTTPLAGSHLTSHLRSLLLLFGTYIPPPTSLSAAANIPAANRSMRVPQEVLTDVVLEEVKTRCCFVSDALDSNDMRVLSPTEQADDTAEMDILPSSDPAISESEFSRGSLGVESNQSSQAASTDFSIISHPQIHRSEAHRSGQSHLQALADLYKRHSTATDLHMRVLPPVTQQTGTGRGTLIIPGWIRERAAEVLFEGGDVDERTIAEVILDCLLKTPVDLRKTFASSILVVGGTSMLPGFIPRLYAELQRTMSPTATLTRQQTHSDKHTPPIFDRYASLRSLSPSFAILNTPTVPPIASDTSARAAANAGKAPAFSPGIMAWVGGSLAGALKIGGIEISREKWDEAEKAQDDEDEDDEVRVVAQKIDRQPRSIIPDWTQVPLPAGAPPAVPVVPQISMTSASLQTMIGA